MIGNMNQRSELFKMYIIIQPDERTGFIETWEFTSSIRAENDKMNNYSSAISNLRNVILEEKKHSSKKFQQKIFFSLKKLFSPHKNSATLSSTKMSKKPIKSTSAKKTVAKIILILKKSTGIKN